MNTEQPFSTSGYGTDGDARQRAIRRLNARRGFIASAVMWLVVNTFLVILWAGSGGFFWPMFTIIFWGLGIFWQGMAAFGPRTTEEQIQREMRRMGDES